MAEQVSARVTWQSRWNKSEVASTFLQNGAEVIAANYMGTLTFDLRNDEDVKEIVRRMRLWCDMIEGTKAEYDRAMKEIESHPLGRSWEDDWTKD